jgi:hypothetical protein
MLLRNLNLFLTFAGLVFFFDTRIGWAMWEIEPLDANVDVKTEPSLFLPVHDL